MRYQCSKITGNPIEGYVIYDPHGNPFPDIHPKTIVKELNKQLSRVIKLKNENDAMRADLLLWKKTK